jgi:hypothetical protein
MNWMVKVALRVPYAFTVVALPPIDHIESNSFDDRGQDRAASRMSDLILLVRTIATGEVRK